MTKTKTVTTSAAPTRLTKTFNNANSMHWWLSNPLNHYLYKVIFVDHEKHSVKLEGRQLPATVGPQLENG